MYSLYGIMCGGCRAFYRPKAPFNEWMSQAGDGNATPVQPTEQELAILDKV